MAPPLIFLSAGDPSGDIASARLVEQIKSKIGEVEFVGLGGERLRELGQEQLAEPLELAVLGFWEVAKRFFFFRRLMRRCVELIATRHPAVVVLVDYPGFNLRLAERIKPLGISIVYYISPQVWAWKKQRLDQIDRLVDTMLLILPFETKLYRDQGTNHEFVGHYLLEDIPAAYIASQVPRDGALALLPGSRPQEIQRHLPVMIEAARFIYEETGVRAVVAARRDAFDYERCTSRFGAKWIEIVYDDARRVVNDARLVLTSSGTATLETAIIGRPMVVIYKTGWITYQIARRLVTLDMIALANLVLGKKVVPELIQHEASARRIADEALHLLTNEDAAEDMVRELNRTPKVLGGKGASARAAEAIAQVMSPGEGT